MEGAVQQMREKPPAKIMHNRAGRTKKDPTHTVLSARAKRFVYARILEVTGFIIAIGVAAIAVALFSYTPNDPSLNNATNAEPANPLGKMGAIAADLLIQGFGLAGYLPLIGFGVWSMRLIAKRAVVAPIWRSLSLLLATIAAGVALSTLPNLSNWPLFNGMGGVIGSLVFERSLTFFGSQRKRFDIPKPAQTEKDD